MSLRNFSSTAIQTTLVGGITGSGTSLDVAATTGFPAAPFILCLEPGTANQELILVTNVAGTTLTVTRGYDSTTGVAHNTGAVVQHSHAAIDLREANTHVNASTGVHGVAGAVVGTTDTQTLTGKTISADSNTLSGIAASSFVLSDGSGNIDGAAAQKVIPAGVVVGTTDAQTLTNKTLALGSNSVSGTLAQLNTAVTDADVASLAGAEDLTNKTLTNPKITDILTVLGATYLEAQGGTGSSNQYLTIRPGTSGGETPKVSVDGTGANIDLDLQAKGTGKVLLSANTTVDGGTTLGAWTTFTPTLGGWTLGNGTLTGKYVRIGKTVHYRIEYTVGSTDTIAGTPTWAMPVNGAVGVTSRTPCGVATLHDTSATAYRHYVAGYTVANVILVFNPDGSLTTATAPWTWATGDHISITGTYEAA